MGFKLTPSETFMETVTVNVKQDNGSWRTESFQGIFERATEEEREELGKAKFVDLLRKKMVGWKMKDHDTKEDVPFTPENFEAFLKLHGAVREAAQAFWTANAGAKEKN